MRRKYICLIFITYSFTFFSKTQAQNPDRKYISHTWQEPKLTIKTNDGTLTLSVFNEYIIEVSFEENGFQNPDSSHVIVVKPEKTKVYFSENDNLVQIQMPTLTATIQKSPFQIKFGSHHNKINITSENLGYFERKDSTHTYKGFKFNLDNTEYLYGTGERALPLDRRGHRLELYNKAHYGYADTSYLMGYNIPMVLSSKTYAVYFDNAQRGFVDLGKTDKNTLSFESMGGKMTYYFITGKDFPELLENYTWLTGRQPLPPRWAFGNFATRYGYKNEKQVREVVVEFRKQDFPLDAVVLDHYWYGEGEIKKSVAMGDLDWYKPNWESGAGLAQDLKKQNIETVLITQPFVLTNSKNYKETSEKGLLGKNEKGETFVIPYFYFGETGILDIFKPETRDWFWEKYKKHIDTGINGWWGDLGEPEVHPSELLHSVGRADEVHNIYGHYWAKLIAEGYQKEYSSIRPFILMRAGFAGSQRFGLIPWSGDVSRTWGGFRSQIPIALNMSMCGLAYMHSDLGGFAGGKLSPELYIRWLQYGVFQPIYRPHSQESVPSEPIYYADSTQKIVRKAIKLRYQLLPYNYTLAYQNSMTGLPMMRPLFFLRQTKSLHEESQKSNSYLWGDAFLVIPITNKGQKQVEVNLPYGYTWYDFWSSKAYEGGLHEIQITLENIPVFVRSGTFVPMVNEINNTNDYSSKNLTVHYFYEDSEEEQEGILYEDDGKNAQAIAQKQYEILEFEAEKERKYFEIEFEKSQETYANAPKKRHVTLIIHGKKFSKVKGKKIDKKTLNLTYDEAKNQTTVKFLWEKEELELRLR